MEASSTQLLNELETIRAYSFIILIMVAGILVCVAIATITFVGAIKSVLNMAKERHFVFREYAEDLLAQNKIEELLNELDKRLVSHPNDAYAYCYKGQALFRSGKIHESKRAFEAAHELDPAMDIIIKYWKGKIENKINESSPKIVE